MDFKTKVILFIYSLFLVAVISAKARGDTAKVVIAVIDTGTDINHPELKNKIWHNPGEIGLDKNGIDRSINGIDDDSNGYIDDVHGWNFAQNNNNLFDNHGHGTHISGIISAEGNGRPGFKGFAPHAELMILKYFDPMQPASSSVRNTVRAINYAVKMKAKIINYSSGGMTRSHREKEAIHRALKKGVLFVAAAGNEHANADIFAYYPASYDLPNILSVTATDNQRNILSTSNYGVRNVDVSAPGENIFSTLPGEQYGTMSGTSQATAVVTGLAAHLMHRRPEMTEPEKIIETIVGSSVKSKKLAGKTRYQIHLDSIKSLGLKGRDLNSHNQLANNTKIQKKKA